MAILHAQVNSTMPKKFSGCWKGFIRDKHYYALVISWLFFFFLLSVILCKVGACIGEFFNSGGGIAFVVIFGLMFIIESLCCSQTYEYLRHMKMDESSVDLVKKLHAQAPTVSWHMQCYHMETETYTVTVDDGDDGSHQETRTRQVRRNTHSASRTLTVLGWKDISSKTELANLTEYQVTKLDLDKVFHFDPHHEVEKQKFIADNNRDVSYDFSEHQGIDGFANHLLALADTSQKPYYLSADWYLAAQMTIIFAVPYRIWLSSISGKVHHTIVKQVHTAPPEVPPPQPAAKPEEPEFMPVQSADIENQHADWLEKAMMGADHKEDSVSKAVGEVVASSPEEVPIVSVISSSTTDPPIEEVPIISIISASMVDDSSSNDSQGQVFELQATLVEEVTDVSVNSASSKQADTSPSTLSAEGGQVSELQQTIDIINSRHSAADVLNGLKKLINLGLKEPREHALKFSQMGGITGVVALLEEYESNASIQEKALKLLVNVSFASEEASREMMKRGIVKRALASLQAHPTAIEVQAKGLWVLKNMAHYIEGASEVKDCGGIELAANSIKNMIKDRAIVDQGLGILQNVVQHMGPEQVSLAWKASGVSFEGLKSIHASSPRTIELASNLEKNILVS